jgi:hypothetical protein
MFVTLWGGGDWGDYISRLASEDPVSTNKNLGVVVGACHPSLVGNISGSGWLGHKCEPLSPKEQK